MLVLPKFYGALDSEFNCAEGLPRKLPGCLDFGKTQYLHFTAKGKPWTRSAERDRVMYGEEYYPDPRVRRAFTEWFHAAHDVCPQVFKVDIHLAR